MKVNLISLGCPKNLADSERLLRGLAARGVTYTDQSALADVIIVNTCGFIEDAKRESIDEILEASQLRGKDAKLVVMGCLSERYAGELRADIPEIDALFGVAQDERIIEFVAGSLNASHKKSPITSLLIEQGIAVPTVPLKVAEGCGRKCAYCAIPLIRGPFISRSPDEILKEAEEYVRRGAKELMLVAQDLTAYGRDIMKGEYRLPELLRDIASVSGDFWIRPMYLYPDDINAALLRVIADEPKIVKYIDMPLQHTEDRMLRLMRRGGTRARLLSKIERIRKAVPGATLRTSFIVGFPGEREEDFRGLLDLVKQVRFERLGAFVYSREEGTLAASLPDQVPAATKRSRYGRLMKLQMAISRTLNETLVGQVERVLIEEVEADIAYGRISGQAQEIDGMTIIRGGGKLRPGTFVDAIITLAGDYDLEARVQ